MKKEVFNTIVMENIDSTLVSVNPYAGETNGFALVKIEDDDGIVKIVGSSYVKNKLKL